MKLTNQQIRFFDTFGFLKFPGLFAEEIESISEGFEQVWAEHGGGHADQPHDHERRSALAHFIDQNKYLCALIDDPRIEGIAALLLGDDFNYEGSDGNYYVGDTPWHSDGYYRKYRAIKMSFYLDPLTQDTGCLRVIPGSHRTGDGFADAVHQMAADLKENNAPAHRELHGRDVPAVALETAPGDLVMFNQTLKHAAFGGGTKRRMFTICMEQRHREEDLPLLRETMGKEARFWIESAYGEVLVRTAGPGRMVHLEQRLANDRHMPELARKARQERSEPSRG